RRHGRQTEDGRPQPGRRPDRPRGHRPSPLRLPRLATKEGGVSERPFATPASRGTYGGGVSSAQMIDWNVATSTGVRWVRPGPQVTMAEARKVVAELRQLAAEVSEPVRTLTGLPGSDDDGLVAVVDRPGWIRANVDGFRVVLDPLVEHLSERGATPPGRAGRGGGVSRRPGGPRGRPRGLPPAVRARPRLPRPLLKLVLVDL